MRNSFDWKDAGAALSLANLFYVVAWKDIVFTGWNHYYRPEQPSVLEYLVILANVLLLAFVFLGLLTYFRSSRSLVRMVSHALFLLLGILALGPLSHELVKWLVPQTERVLNFYVPFGVLLGCLVFSLREKCAISAVAAKLKQFALFLLPFTILVAFKIGWDQYNSKPEDFLPQSIQRTDHEDQSGAGRRAVWIVFDELDGGLLTAASNNGTDIKDINRLAEQAFVALNAYAPNNRTQESIPSLLTGVPLREAFTVAPNEMLMYPADEGQPISLREHPNVFSELGNRGRRSAIVGWYHPYCRVFSDEVSDCYWSPLASPDCSGFVGFSGCSRRIFLQALEFVPLATRVFTSLPERNFALIGESRAVQSARNSFLTGKIHALLADSDLGLLFFHSSIPHLPIIGRHNSDDENDYSALEMVNDTVREIRNLLEARGEWDDALVIVSSDHASRFKSGRSFDFLPEREKQAALDDRRVPFFVKLPGQTSRVAYAPTVNTVITKRLILDVLDGELDDPNDLLSWLEKMQQSHPELINRKNVGRPW